MNDYNRNSDLETGGDGRGFVAQNNREFNGHFETSSQSNLNSSSQSSGFFGSVKETLWSTTTRKLITISIFWAILLIILCASLYTAGKNSSPSSPDNGGAVVKKGSPAVTYVGGFRKYLGDPDTAPVPMVVNLTIGYVADTALTEDTQALYALMKKEKAEIIVVSGDLDYIDNPEGWDRLITNVLGADYPMLVGAGNHDYKIWPRYQNFIIDRWQAADIKYCNGIVGFAHTCTYKGVTIVQIAPGVFNETGGTYKNLAGIGDFDMVGYIRDSFAQYGGNKFKVCAWHKNQNQMQTGQKKDETGWGVYNECLRQGAMIMTGHEHSYERTYLMTDLENQTIAPGNEARNMEISATKGFVVVQGLGGRGVRPNYNDGPHWAVTDNTNTSATFSGTVCKYNLNGDSNKAYCYTKDLRSKIIDDFYITLNSGN